MNKYTTKRLIGMRICSLVSLALFFAPPDRAQTPAGSPVNAGPSETTSAPPFCCGPLFATSGFHPRVADSTRAAEDQKLTKELNKAWQASAEGTSGREGVVLIFRMVDGSYKGRSLGFTNEYQKFTFKWNPAAFAIVHTHPNSSDPRPAAQDKLLADKYGVANFTITMSGMYLYDPANKKTSKVLNGLDWLDPFNLPIWTQEIARIIDSSANQVPESGCEQNPAAVAARSVNTPTTAQPGGQQKTGTPDPLATITSVDPHLVNPLTHLWNLGVQRQTPGNVIVDVAYVGSRGTRLLINEQLNPGIDGIRIFSTRGPVTLRTNGGDSIYHSLQTRVERGLRKGLLARFAYTYSKTIDDVISEVFVTTGGSSVGSNPFDRRKDRSVASGFVDINGNPVDPANNRFLVDPANRVNLAGRNTLRGDRVNSFDASFNKAFKLRFEGHRLGVRLESFNVFNHPNFTFANPNVSSDLSNGGVTNPFFNNVRLNNGGNRTGRIKLRYAF